jgi:Flp pilus assembly protein TadG
MGAQLRKFRKTGNSSSGTSVLEFALIGVVFFLLLFGIIDFGTLFYVYESMEHGISEATRYGLTGQQKPDPAHAGQFLSREDSIKMVMRQNSRGITLADSCFTFEHISVNGTTWSSGSGGSGEISRVTVRYNWRAFTPFIQAFFTGGQAPLRVSATVKNETFD